jgi:hypothetical protein
MGNRGGQGRASTHFVGILGVDVVLDGDVALFPKIIGRNLHEVGDLCLSIAYGVSMTACNRENHALKYQDEHLCCCTRWVEWDRRCCCSASGAG